MLSSRAPAARRVKARASRLRRFGNGRVSSWGNGQDLIEYTLLLAFVALVAMGLFIQSGGSTSGIGTIAKNHLNNASSGCQRFLTIASALRRVEAWLAGGDANRFTGEWRSQACRARSEHGVNL